ncbi:MAG: phosphatidylserine/phosphatidylglycerophosphate/cardiolipin synthase family protein [Gammaproteobacteria bacterium]|nr:phosphatidylserine/phosphatidylglycerophosphate/cardiolipin synthase family protein [Gammaproteobacteria bacterium]
MDYRYPWRDGNVFDLLVDGSRYFPVMIQSIEQAKHVVLLEMYLVESGHISSAFIHACIQAANNGVSVYILLDDFGCRGLKMSDRELLNRQNISTYYYNPMRYGRLRRAFFRDHRKLLVVDAKVGFIGGSGLTDDFYAQYAKNHKPWHDLMVQLKGPCLTDCVDMFLHTWRQAQGDILKIQPFNVHQYVHGVTGRLTQTQGKGTQEIKTSLLKRLRSVERSVFLSTAYFVPSHKIRRALKSAARRGVHVNLLLPGRFTDHPAVRHAGRRFYASLLKAGVNIYEYQPRFLHAKVLLCDNWASIGSSNIDRWNFRWNLEANIEIDDPQFAKVVTDWFELGFSDSQRFQYSSWHQRPWLSKILEWFWGKVDILLDRVTRR